MTQCPARIQDAATPGHWACQELIGHAGDHVPPPNGAKCVGDWFFPDANQNGHVAGAQRESAPAAANINEVAATLAGHGLNYDEAVARALRPFADKVNE